MATAEENNQAAAEAKAEVKAPKPGPSKAHKVAKPSRRAPRGLQENVRKERKSGFDAVVKKIRATRVEQKKDEKS